MTAEQVASDLRNAAHVVDAAGWTPGVLIKPVTGQVCLDGALELATGAQIRTVRFGIGVVHGKLFEPFYGRFSGYARLLRARQAVARLIPECSCLPVLSGGPEPMPKERVVHFNDTHCRGGEDAQRLLIEAAEKVEAEL